MSDSQTDGDRLTAAEILGYARGTVKSCCAHGRARLLPLVSHLKQVEAGC